MVEENNREKKMKIGFDGKRAVQNFTGLGNYSRYVIEALCRFAPDNDYCLYAPVRRNSAVFDQMMQKCSRMVDIYPEGIWKMFRSLWRVFGVTFRLQEDKVDIFHGLSNELPLNILRDKKIKKVVTLHDVIFLRYPSYYRWIDRKIYAYKFRKSCEHADVVIAISECTKRDIISFFHIPEGKIQVVYQGCDSSFTHMSSVRKKEEVKKRYALPDRYILNVGSVERRKNVLLAVKALKALPMDVHLVIVGKHTPYANEVEAYAKTHGLESRVHLMTKVSFEDLPTVYQLSEVFVYPSRFEGFGIPILEALHSGVPVVAATGSCLEEAGGPDSLYVHPDDEEGMIKALLRTLDSRYREHMITNGKKHAALFSEEKQARQLNELYFRLIRR